MGPDGPDEQTLAALHGTKSPPSRANGKPKVGQKKKALIKKLSTKDISAEDVGGAWDGDGLDDLDLDDDTDAANKQSKSSIVKKVEIKKESKENKGDLFEDF